MTRIALKVDCDTFEGTRVGIPNLLALFERKRIRATFFFTLGPDNSGRAIRRVFTRRGFLRKMLRSNAAALYGPKTMLYGTLLPAPVIGDGLADVIRTVAAAGHETGVHGWDHVRWHDSLDRLTDDEIRADYGRAHASFERIFGRKARASAAPGWHATPAYLRIQEGFDLTYASNTRGGTPCFVDSDLAPFRTLEIPTTLPTWDETLGTPDLPDDDAMIAHYRGIVRDRTEVHTIHTEVEGAARLALFSRQIEAWQSDGVAFLPLEEIARESLDQRDQIPVRMIVRTEIPNRGGLITATAGPGAEFAERPS